MMNSTNFVADDIVAVVLEYHRPNVTLHCLKSLAAANVKHIVVWDNSTDAGMTSVELSRALANDEHLSRRVTVVSNNVNLGFSAGVNAAIAYISNVKNLRYILLINNDASINTEGVKALFDALTCDFKHAAAAPKFLNNGGKNHALLYYNSYLAALTEKTHLGSFAFLSGCCLLMDLAKTGTAPMDEGFFMYGEDVALSHELQKKGFRLAIAESARVEHIGAASSVIGSQFYEYHVVRGHLLLTSRISTSWIHAAVLWPPRLISLIARALLRTVRAKNLTPLVALWRAIFGLGTS